MGRLSRRVSRPAATLRCDSRCGPDVRPGGGPGTAALARRSGSMADLRDHPDHEPADPGRGQQPPRVAGRSCLSAPGLHEPDVVLDGLDDLVHLAAEYLLGEAEREALG